ncbi:MAG: hypothetical protein M3Y87_31110 [Myxococcota bacterium]|nr:hypothetical protein [Myxococcota bacterium]
MTETLRMMIATATFAITIAGCAGSTDPNARRGGAIDGGPIAMPPSDASEPASDAATPGPLELDASIAIVPGPPGSRCACDAECEGNATHPGVCVYGICMTRPSGECSAGSRAECSEGSRCWRVRDTDGFVCWPDCDAFSCGGTCDADGSCVGRGELDCDPACGSFCGEPPCSTRSPSGPCAGEGEMCIGGSCVGACSPAEPTGSCPEGEHCSAGVCEEGTTCPDWRCTGTDCAALVMLPGSTDPASAESIRRGYYVDTRTRYTWLRRDLVLLLQHATCEVARRFPGTAPLGIQDLSQMDGLTPGSDVGDLRHPSTTHRGNDLDLSYYQTDGDNDSHIVCGDGSDTNYNGRAGRYNDGYFCTTERNIVDWPREAYFFAMLGTSPLVRIFGVDTTFVDDLRTELDAQLARGWISAEQHERANDLGWGSAGGWQFHHHHSHMSFSRL